MLTRNIPFRVRNRSCQEREGAGASSANDFNATLRLFTGVRGPFIELLSQLPDANSRAEFENMSEDEPEASTVKESRCGHTYNFTACTSCWQERPQLCYRSFSY